MSITGLFSLFYAIANLFSGKFIDWMGTKKGYLISIFVWSTGAVWNTMPPHTHGRRIEAYYYFNLPDGQTISHVMGQPQESRNVWLHNDQAIMSPEWSMHAAAGTYYYTFIWGMAGENLYYNDKDNIPVIDIR